MLEHDIDYMFETLNEVPVLTEIAFVYGEGIGLKSQQKIKGRQNIEKYIQDKEKELQELRGFISEN